MYVVVLITISTLIRRNLNNKSQYKQRWSSELHVSPSTKTHQSFSTLVYYSVSMFSVSDWIPGFYFIFWVIFSTDVSLAAALQVESPGCPLLIPMEHGKTSDPALPNRLLAHGCVANLYIYHYCKIISSLHFSYKYNSRYSHYDLCQICEIPHIKDHRDKSGILI